MSAISLRLPESLHEEVRKLAKKEKISINRFITLGLAEKFSAMATTEYFERRAARADHRKFERALGNASAAAPDKCDRI